MEATKREQWLRSRKIGNLVWSDRSSNEMNWSRAKQYCENLSEGGFTDWRLPTISELRTTIKNCSGSKSGGSCRVSDSCLAEGCWSENCYCPSEGSYNKLSGDDGEVWLWSSSTRSDDRDDVWHVYYPFAEVGLSHKSDNDGYVRCVR